MEEYEDHIVSLYVEDTYNKKEKLCTEISNICNENYVDDDDNDVTRSSQDFEFLDKDEL